jgi:hypothetical protein
MQTCEADVILTHDCQHMDVLRLCRGYASISAQNHCEMCVMYFQKDE